MVLENRARETKREFELAGDRDFGFGGWSDYVRQARWATLVGLDCGARSILRRHEPVPKVIVA